MWRLTDAALRDGVKSTTRYRSKQPNKRGSRTMPQPQRQVSGAKGGQAARRAAHIKRTKRVYDYQRSDPYTSSSRSNNNNSHAGVYHASDTVSKSFAARSPYFDGNVEFAYNPSSTPTHGLPLSPADFGGSPHMSLSTPTSDLFATQTFPDGYILSPHGVGEPMFTNSPTPSADEPRTPGSQGWEEGMGIGAAVNGVVEGMRMGLGFPSIEGYAGMQDYRE